MRVLVACEFSGTVRDAFARRGHESWSCDLLESETPGNHYKADVRKVLGYGWDLMIAHPPCTYLASSGLHWNKRRPGRAAKTEEALGFVKLLLDAPIPKIALENPVGCISTRIRKPDQIIQPYEYGHPESKTTCLWLKNLPHLKATKILEPEWAKNPDGSDFRDAKGKRYSPTHYYSGRMQRDAGQGMLFPDARHKQRARWANQTPSGQNKLGPSPDRWKLRSRFYRGWAEAMAAQWGE